MLSLAQTARYIKLQEQCLMHNACESSCIVPVNQFTCESVKCSNLPDIGLTTEVYIKWVLDLPMTLTWKDRRELVNSVAKMVCGHAQSLAEQREAIKPSLQH